MKETQTYTFQNMANGDTYHIGNETGHSSPNKKFSHFSLKYHLILVILIQSHDTGLCLNSRCFSFSRHVLMQCHNDDILMTNIHFKEIPWLLKGNLLNFQHSNQDL